MDAPATFRFVIKVYLDLGGTNLSVVKVNNCAIFIKELSSCGGDGSKTDTNNKPHL